jgi:hypothetical protein
MYRMEPNCTALAKSRQPRNTVCDMRSSVALFACAFVAQLPLASQLCAQSDAPTTPSAPAVGPPSPDPTPADASPDPPAGPSAPLIAPAAVAAAAPTLGPAERWVDVRRVDRLEASLVELAHTDSIIRQWGFVGALIVGGALIAGGVLVGVDEKDWGGKGRAALSVAAWASGASLIGAGIYRAFSRTPAEDRLERWSALRQNKKLDVFEFARIEGELANEAELARFNRRLAAFSSFGLVAGGAGLIGFAASSEFDGAVEDDAYILGGVLAGVGAIQAVALLIQRTPAERAWKHYSEGGGGFFSLRPTAPSAPRLVWTDAPELRSRM